MYSNLLAPLYLGFLTLRNRIVMGAMHTRIETLDRPTERLVAFYAERARGETALLLTGGFAPNLEGRIDADTQVFADEQRLAAHRAVCDAVHREGGRIALQILHAGRYAKLPECVAPSPIRARINRYAPRTLATAEVWRTIADYARTARLARQAGYDGVEIMGSEGYLINEFTSPVTNRRDDEFGGGLDGRLRLPLEILQAVRKAAGDEFLVIYRISTIDLVDGGMPAEEIVALARHVQDAGANILNSGIGWHESPVPTIAASVPRATWSFATRRVKEAVTIPVIASNRINDPDVAEQLLASGAADLVSMARPLLADPEFALKTRTGRAAEIATCVACNQSCLDQIFNAQPASCLVNPRACREPDFPVSHAATVKRIGVVGAGPAGLAFAVNAAEQGHRVCLFEAAETIGGQLNLARLVPGKSEFGSLLRSYQARMARLGVELHLGERVDAAQLAAERFDEIVVATGARPRIPAIPGIGNAMVVTYADVLSGRIAAGRRVAIVGAGGIGFDVAAFLLLDPAAAQSPAHFLDAWHVDAATRTGGLSPPFAPARGEREVTLLQRKPDKPGTGLGKTTGWILKSRLRDAGLHMVSGASYTVIDSAGLHYTLDGRPQVLEADQVILCAGQESERTLFDTLQAGGVHSHLIGGADQVAELDAARAIEQATQLALQI
jgi:2,4-dienoyl-CoA reductase (NADPH2)